MTELTPAEVKAAEARAIRHSYPKRLLTAIDQFLNVVTGGNLGETISARSQRAANRGSKFGKFMSWWLGKIQRHHGALAEAGDLARAEKVETEEEMDLGIGPDETR